MYTFEIKCVLFCSVSVSVYMYEPRYVLKHSRALFSFHVLHSTILHYVSRITGRKDGGNVSYSLCQLQVCDFILCK